MRIRAFSPALWAAAALQGAGMGRAINLGAGLVLVAIGAGLRAMRGRRDAN